MNPSENVDYQLTHHRNPSPPRFISLQSGNQNVTGTGNKIPVIEGQVRAHYEKMLRESAQIRAELNDLKNSVLVRKDEENLQLRKEVDKTNLEKKRVEEKNANLLCQLGEKDKALKAAEEENKRLQSLHKTIIGDLQKEHEKEVDNIQTNLIGTELKLEEVNVLSTQKKRELEKQVQALQIHLAETKLELEEKEKINSDLNRKLCTFLENQGTDPATPRVQLEESTDLEDLQAHCAETSSRKRKAQCISRQVFGPTCPMRRKVEKNGTQVEAGSSASLKAAEVLKNTGETQNSMMDLELHERAFHQ